MTLNHPAAANRVAFIAILVVGIIFFVLAGAAR